MATSFIDATSADDGANDDIIVTAPTGIQDNDLLLGFYACYGDTEITALPVTLSGFTQLTSKFEQVGTDVTLAIFYKVASSESGNYTFTGSHTGTPETSAMIAVFRGVDTSTPFDVTFVEGTHYVRSLDFGTGTDEFQPANITTNTDNAWTLIFSWVGFGNITDFSGPTGFTEREQIIGANRNIHFTTKEQATAGIVNPGTITAAPASDSTDSSTYTLALKSSVAVGQTVTFDLVSKNSVPQASLTSVAWAWFDQDVGALSAPTDKGNTEISDSSGEMILDLANTTLTTGQTGTLVLYDSTGGKIGAYRLPID
jgi:hypothetical protein